MTVAKGKQSAAVDVPAYAGSSVTVRHGSLTSRWGYTLHTTSYLPTSRPHRNQESALLFHHGLSDQSARHTKVLRHLAEQLSIPVFTFDCHAHGRSGPQQRERGNMLGANYLVDDLVDFTEHISKGHAGTGPCHVFLFGYSMGGMACILAAQRRPDLVKGLMLTSALTDILPFLLPHQKWIVILVMRALALLCPSMPFFPCKGLSTIGGDRLEITDGETSDTAGKKGGKKRYVGKANWLSVSTTATLLHGCGLLLRRSHAMQLPVYAQHGTHDRLCSLHTLKAFLASISSRDVQLVVVEGGRHDLHHDDAQLPKCLQAMEAWLMRHLPA